MGDTVIKVDSVSKRYRLGLQEKSSDTLAGTLANLVKAPWRNFNRLRSMSRFKEDDESVFWALKDVSFEVKEGEVLGIIGKNGAGKSTLLKILSQITEPTSGQIEITGRVASLLEVGTGFHPELTGRENIYMNGTILGMTKKEIDRKMDEIVDFSGVEKFLDTPVKFYSSGMKVRLGFSVAAHLEPEILIIDEVLAVGDYEFQNKCLGKMQDVASAGRTVLFVSHNLSAVSQLCQTGILLHNGEILIKGDIQTTLKSYIDSSNTSTTRFVNESDKQTNIYQAFLFKNTFVPSSVFAIDELISLKITIKSKIKLHFASVGIALLDKMERKVFTDVFDVRELSIGLTDFVIELPRNLLMPGVYSFDIAIFNSSPSIHDYINNVCRFQVEDTGFDMSKYTSKDDIGIIRVKCSWSRLN